jgi:pimeloyl-ACP methyl ester carboxylesterase
VKLVIEPRNETIVVEGAGLCLRRVGMGPPVLLTHGVPGDMETLAPVADRLAANAEAITVSLRYAGPGPHGTRTFGTEEQLLDLRDLIVALDLGPVHLVAWSYSAHAALACAVRHPELIRSLFLYEPGFPTFITDPGTLDAIRQDMVEAFAPVFEAVACGDLATALRNSIDAAANCSGWFNDQPDRVKEVHQRNAHMLPLLMTQSPPIALSAPDLGLIGCPTTVSWGDRTRSCYSLVSQEAAGLIPDARTVVVKGAGHLLPESEPASFAKNVADHIARTNKVK